MKAAEIDVRLSRKPIERYEWPLGAAILALAVSILISERKRARQTVRAPARAPVATASAVAALILLSLSQVFAAAPGLDAYRDGKFTDAYQEFQQTLKTHPQTSAADKLHFDSGAAAYKMKDYGKALESFSQALLSPDMGLQGKSHYNLGNTLYEHGEAQQGDEKKLTDWENALQHYEQTLKLEPQNKEAKDNYDYVKKKIEELKKKKQQQPPPQNKQQKNDKQDKQDKQEQQQNQQNQQQQSSQQNQKQDQQEQQSQAQNQPGAGENQKPENKQDQSQAKNEQQKNQQPKPGETQSPSPSPAATPQKGQPSPSPGEGKKEQPEQSPTPGDGQNATPSPSPGEGEGSGEGSSPSPTPEGSPRKKLAGEVKGAAGDKSEKPDETAQIAEAEAEKEGQMSERQAEALLQSMKDEEARVQLDERRAARRVYNDW
jgi:Ca-activated chloride channel family protein